MSSSSLSCFWGVMSHGGKLERCSVPLESWCGGTDRGGELLMMSRRSRAGDRPLAYPHPLPLCRFHVFAFVVLAAGRAAIVIPLALVGTTTCIIFS